MSLTTACHGNVHRSVLTADTFRYYRVVVSDHSDLSSILSVRQVSFGFLYKTTTGNVQTAGQSPRWPQEEIAIRNCVARYRQLRLCWTKCTYSSTDVLAIGPWVSPERLEIIAPSSHVTSHGRSRSQLVLLIGKEEVGRIITFLHNLFNYSKTADII